MSDPMYETDALAWSDQQAAMLRRLAAGERVNDAIDWPNVIEEVQDVGLSELRACNSLLMQAMTHLLKLYAWPASSAAEHWSDETGNFLSQAQLAFSPSMRQRLQANLLYAGALRLARRSRDRSGEPKPLPDACPWTLDELLDGDVEKLAAKLASTEPR